MITCFTKGNSHFLNTGLALPGLPEGPGLQMWLTVILDELLKM